MAHDRETETSDDHPPNGGELVATCQVCEGRAQLFLCVTHIGVLQTKLNDAPWWLDRLTEAALGQVRLGDGGRRATRAHELDEYTGPDDVGNADRLERDMSSGKFTMDKVLSSARINAKASRLYSAINGEFTTWVQHLCEARGVDVPRLAGPEDAARWLRKHANAIAADEAAGEFYKALVDSEDQIRHVVNRPEPPRFCGPCTSELTTEQRAWLRKHDQEDRAQCMTQLYARRGVDSVTCPFCSTEHGVKDLHDAMQAVLDGLSFTVTDLVDDVLPKLNCHVKKRYMQYRVKLLNPSGYEVNPKTHQQVQRYLFSDVREMLEREGKLEVA